MDEKSNLSKVSTECGGKTCVEQRRCGLDTLAGTQVAFKRFIDGNERSLLCCCATWSLKDTGPTTVQR